MNLLVYTYQIIPIRQLPRNFVSNEKSAKEFKHFQYTLENYPPKCCNNYIPTYSMQDGMYTIWKRLLKIMMQLFILKKNLNHLFL